MFRRRRAVCLGLLLCGVAWRGVAQAAPKPVLEMPFRVVIDPGHGGSNSGCLAADGRSAEKQVTLALALRLEQALLRKLPHAEVLLTRRDDRSMTLRERVELANASAAQVFVSLHANASATHGHRGFESYVLSPERHAFEAWRRGQELGLQTGSIVADPAELIVADLELGSRLQQSIDLALELQRQQAGAFPQRLDRGVKQAAFDVLSGLHMPGVLIELGFLDHDDEAGLLLDAAGQDRIASALAEALLLHYRRSLRR